MFSSARPLLIFMFDIWCQQSGSRIVMFCFWWRHAGWRVFCCWWRVLLLLLLLLLLLFLVLKQLLQCCACFAMFFVCGGVAGWRVIDKHAAYFVGGLRVVIGN